MRFLSFLLILFSSLSLHSEAPAKKVALVAGGAGFLGSHLCERLLEENYQVICVDNLCTGNLKNIEHLKENTHFKFLNQDVISPLSLEGRVDEVYNLACPASPPKYQMDPVHTLKTNFLGTLNLLELAKDKNAIFFQASTSEIYGDPKVHPQKEEYWGNVNPIGIRACYDEGKRVAETLCFEYNRQYGVAVKVARIFNTYGPRLSKEDGRVVSNFLKQAIGGQPLTIFGDGTQTRSFCYVDDLITGFRKFMKTDVLCTGPINLGNPCEFTMNELAQMVTHQLNPTGEVLYKTLPKDDPTKRKPDITKAKALLDWEPKVDLKEGLEKTASFYLEKSK